MMELEEQCILLELQSTDKESLLEEMAGAVQEKYPAMDKKTVRQVLMEREQIGSTGVGNGVAIPHGKFYGLERCLLCFGRSVRGIAFDAKDNKPVHFIIMILSPVDMVEEYLQVLARVSRVMNNAKNRNLFLRARSKKVIQQLFIDS
ncbi:MAG: PTS sugar transporter subunit IIA [Candidatus Electrothrix sp. YB6]